MSGVEVKNTVCFDFGNGSSRPTLQEVARFIKTLEASPADIEASYRIAEEKAIFVKFKSEECMRHALQQNDGELDFHYENGKTVKVKMSQAGGKTLYVRVYDLPPEVSDDAVALVLRKYGKVKRVVREKFPAELELNIHTGVRGIYMDVRSEIPSSLHFLNRKGNIFYEGNKNLCFVCNSEDHRMNTCPNRKTRKYGKEQSKENPEQQENQPGKPEIQPSNSSANVGAESSSEDVNGKVPEEVEVIEEEVLEMDESPSDIGTNVGNNIEASKPPIFKYPNDAYYYYKFGIVDHTEKERIRDEEEAKRLALWKEKQREEELERRRQKAEAKLSSPPRKNKKK